MSEELDLPLPESIEDSRFRLAVELLDSGDEQGLRAHLAAHPKLIGQRVELEEAEYFRNPTLLEFVAENPIRRGTLPPNIADLTRVILEAGAKNDKAAVSDTLGLVCSGRIARECRVQVSLLELLCGYGADPNSAMLAALAHAEFEAAEALIRNGARMDLVVAGARGMVEESTRLVGSASGEERHRALALAAQFGHAEIVRLLLDAGEEPDRYNPAGAHAHSTPLHQAAWAGHGAVIRLLVERGARLDVKDTIWQATAEDWARHARHSEVAEYLRDAAAGRAE